MQMEDFFLNCPIEQELDFRDVISSLQNKELNKTKTKQVQDIPSHIYLNYVQVPTKGLFTFFSSA